MPGMINANKNQSRYFISKKILTLADVNTDIKIGNLLGYNCPITINSKYNYSFHFIFKNGKNIELFNYVCDSPEKISKEKLIYAKKLNDKIKVAFKKYPEIDSKLDAIIAKINNKTKN